MRDIVAAISLFLGAILLSHCSFLYKVPAREAPPARWEKIFFRSIDAATVKSGLVPLRAKPLASDEIELRIWRGFGLSNLEGVVLSRSDKSSSALHILGDDYIEITLTKTKQLSAPRSGWAVFWEKVSQLGVFELADPTEGPCREGMIDGVGHVVEISRNGTYRTYMYPSGLPGCGDSVTVDKIGDLIGEEFYDSDGACERAEWFACSELRRTRREGGLENHIY